MPTVSRIRGVGGIVSVYEHELPLIVVVGDKAVADCIPVFLDNLRPVLAEALDTRDKILTAKRPTSGEADR